MATISMVTFDETITMEEGKTYGLLVAKSTEVTAVHELVTAAGSSKTVTLMTPIDDADPFAPAVGDHIAVGLLGLESIRCLIRDVEPSPNMEARLTLIPEAPAVHSAGDVLPEFDAGTTPVRSLPSPIVTGIVADDTALTSSDTGQIIPRVLFILKPLTIVSGVSLIITGRTSGTTEAFSQFPIQSWTGSEAAIVGVEELVSYDFRLYYTHSNYFTSVAARVDSVSVTGALGNPAGLSDLTIASIGGQALLQWIKHPEVDVIFGGRIYFRWSPELSADDASWPNSVGIGYAVDGGSTHTFLPLKPGTYLARAFDSGGRGSADIAKIDTKQASLLAFSTVDEVVEHPSFSGTKTNVVEDAGALRLDVSGSFADVPVVSELTSWAAAGAGSVTSGSGVYNFAAGMDFGAVIRARLTTHLVAAVSNIIDFIDSPDDWDSDEDVDGATGAPADANVEVRLTDDDPTGSPTWGAWQRVDASDVETWGAEFKLNITTADPYYNMYITELSVLAEEVV